MFNFKTVSKNNIGKNVCFLKIHGVLAAQEVKGCNPHFSQSSLPSTVLFLFYIEKLNCKKKVGGEDFKPSLDAEFQKSLLHGSSDSYQLLLSTTAQLQKKNPQFLLKCPLLAFLLVVLQRQANTFQALNLGPSAPPEKELGYFEVQLYTSFQSHFCRNALSSFLSSPLYRKSH